METRKLFAVLSVLALILAGCTMDIKTVQVVAKDGSARVSQQINMSAYIDYAQKLTESMGALSKPKAPNLNYSSANYASLPSPESQQIALTMDPESADKLAVGGSAFLGFTIQNTGEAMESVSIKADSGAFIKSTGALGGDEYLDSLGKRESKSMTFYGSIANVTPGAHQITLSVDFDRGGKNYTVAKTFSFQVEPEETVKDQMADLEKNMTDTCAEAMAKAPGLDCRYSGGIFTIANTVQPGSDYEFSKEGGLFDTTYKVRISGMPKIGENALDGMGTSQLGGAATTPNKFKDGAPELALMKSVITMSYVVAMPAEITDAPGGEISDDKRSVTYDVYALYDNKQDIQITAKEENAGMKYAVYGIGALIVLGVLFALFRMRGGRAQSSPASRAPPQPPGVDPALADYIRNCYAAGKTKEQIRQALAVAGWAKGDVDYALDRVR
ncbi:MAG: hypothetical protein WC759_01260 [Candidatus Micrarchaeia archaeon]|jgi:hypothetical protein